MISKEQIMDALSSVQEPELHKDQGKDRKGGQSGSTGAEWSKNCRNNP
jgi:hypothetical protein